MGKKNQGTYKVKSWLFVARSGRLLEFYFSWALSLRRVIIRVCFFLGFFRKHLFLPTMHFNNLEISFRGSFSLCIFSFLHFWFFMKKKVLFPSWKLRNIHLSVDVLRLNFICWLERGQVHAPSTAINPWLSTTLARQCYSEATEGRLAT